jgi:hypothetical protein
LILTPPETLLNDLYDPGMLRWIRNPRSQLTPRQVEQPQATAAALHRYTARSSGTANEREWTRDLDRLGVNLGRLDAIVERCHQHPAEDSHFNEICFDVATLCDEECGFVL